MLIIIMNVQQNACSFRLPTEEEKTFLIALFKTANDGELERLRDFVARKTKTEVTTLVNLKRYGYTPLIQACTKGHFKVVKFFLEKCFADIEQVGSVKPNAESPEYGSPLWFASSSGHLNIVKILVQHRASVNSTTNSNFTPLHAACFYGHLDITRYLILKGADVEIASKSGRSPLLIACWRGHYKVVRYLLGNGADVNRKCIKGYTALHYCVQSSSLELLKILLKHGAKVESDSYGITPLLAAAIAGHTSIVEYFIKEYDCSKLNKVNCLKLLGATFIDKKDDITSAYNYWKRAVELRYEDVFRMEKPYNLFSIADYLGVTEVHTFDELENINSDPDKMRIQALLVRERVLGPGYLESLNYIKCRGLKFSYSRNFELSAKLWMYVIDFKQRTQEFLDPLTYSCLRIFANMFNYEMVTSSSFEYKIPPFTFHNVLQVFQRTLKEIETAIKISVEQNKDLNATDVFHRTLICVMHLISLMRALQPDLNMYEDMELKKAAYQLVHLYPRARNGWTPLHYACSKESLVCPHPVYTFPSSEVVDLLLEVGACPNVVDSSNNTPLHIATMNTPCSSGVVKILLSHGAHFDLRNSEGQTPLQLSEQASLVNVYPLRYLSLQCLCAQVIQNNKIPYNGLVHRSLEEFINSH